MLKLIFLKRIFEFMINTAPPASNSVYGREKLFGYDKINFSDHVCHCGAEVRSYLLQQINRVRLLATLFSVSLYFFFCLVSFLNTIFPFGLFFFILKAGPARHAHFKLKSEVLFWKRDLKALDLHTG